MEPTTALLIGSAAIGAFGSIRQGETSAGAYNTQADWSLENAKWSREDADRARLDADRARAETYAREDAQRRGAALQLGKMNAATAQSGVDAGSGSALAIAQQSATMAELDALTMRYEGLLRANQIDRQATGFEREAIGYERQAAAGRYQAKQARIGGYLGAATNVLTSAASYYKPR